MHFRLSYKQRQATWIPEDLQTERTDGQTDRQTDRQTEEQTGTHTLYLYSPCHLLSHRYLCLTCPHQASLSAPPCKFQHRTQSPQTLSYACFPGKWMLSVYQEILENIHAIICLVHRILQIQTLIIQTSTYSMWLRILISDIEILSNIWLLADHGHSPVKHILFFAQNMSPAFLPNSNRGCVLKKCLLGTEVSKTLFRMGSTTDKYNNYSR